MIETLDIQALLAAYERGESLIATGANKKPFEKWKRWQTEQATPEQLKAWANDRRTSGFAVVTGEISRLIILDFDDDDGVQLLQRLGLDPHVCTGRGGFHVRLEYPGHRVATQNSEVTALLHDKWHGLDIRGDGGYAIEWGASEHGAYRTLRDLSQLTPISALPEELAVDLGLIQNNETNGHRTLPLRNGTIKITHPGRHAHLLKVACAMRGRGHEEPQILAELRRINAAECEPPKPDQEVVALAADVAVRYKRGGPAGDQTHADLRAELTKLLRIDAAGLHVVGTELHGQGLTAIAVIKLSNGRTIEADRFQHLLQPQTLNGLVIGATGLVPVIKGEQCGKIASLVVRLAAVEASIGANELAREWGYSFIRRADKIDVDLDNTGDRWGAFKHLDGLNPVAHARTNAASIASASVVLRDTKSGARLVNCSWYHSFVRHEEGASIGHAELQNRMMRVGWERRNKRGAWKATNPSGIGDDREIILPFYTVPAGWEQAE